MHRDKPLPTDETTTGQRMPKLCNWNDVGVVHSSAEQNYALRPTSSGTLLLQLASYIISLLY